MIAQGLNLHMADMFEMFKQLDLDRRGSFSVRSANSVHRHSALDVCVGYEALQSPCMKYTTLIVFFFVAETAI